MENTKRKIQQNGHLLSIYIPAKIIKELNLNKGDEVDIKSEDGKIIIQKS